jgi:hypothetical protein
MIFIDACFRFSERTLTFYPTSQNPVAPFSHILVGRRYTESFILSRCPEKSITMSWRMQQRGIKQYQGFQVIYIFLHSYVYLCLPTYY